MAIYHLSVKAVQRSKGHSIVAKMAYRSGEKIKDERTGKIHDYTKKGEDNVLHREIVTPYGIDKPSRSELWNMAERSEKRKDSCTGREYEVNLPHELTHEQRKEICREFADYLANTYGVAVDICMHEPNEKGDQRNYHAHIMATTRVINNNGLGEKSVLEKAGRKYKQDIENIRAKYAEIVNKSLEKNGVAERVDHRSYERQKKEQLPTRKMGWKATQMERQGIKTEIGDINRNISEKNQKIKTLKKEIDELKTELKRERVRLGNRVSLDDIAKKAVLTEKEKERFDKYLEKGKGNIHELQSKVSQKIKDIENKDELTTGDKQDYRYLVAINGAIDEWQQAEQERLAEQARIAEQERLAEQQRLEQEQQRIAEQERLAEQARIAEQQRIEQAQQEPPQPQIRLTQRQQIVVNELAKYYSLSAEQINGLKESIATVDDDELLPSLNSRYKVGYDKYIELVKEVAQNDKNAKLAEFDRKIAYLKKTRPEQPMKKILETKSSYNERYSKWFTEVGYHDGSIKNLGVQKYNLECAKLLVTNEHHRVVGEKNPHLAKQFREYEKLEQIKMDIIRQFRELE